ncbi:uncharacterized protein LOC120263224 [Dioscorea cayenensis subsp. rotundata]|uniref:Uncharacterized protein LOC120263224 n=1 Tax=Dioscorea cayennensis subsp. rotundata TaxID=55577 RepID=A0AB40BI15_DIOCR|nr:uncharacterized protein LOC120263224 [Dioscorea cayenensis subsp. rotundata]
MEGVLNSNVQSLPHVEEEFVDSDYDMSSGDEDYQEVMNEQREKSRGKQAESDSNGEGHIGFAEFNEEKELYNPRLRVGMVFRDFDQLKKACRNWGIKHRFQLWFPQNDKKRVICACHNKKCSFSIYATHMSKDNPSVQIKSANLDHSCGKVFSNFHVTSRWLATKYFDKFKADPNWSYNGIIKQVKDDQGITISHMKAWRTKNLAMRWVNGDEAEQYTKLSMYAAELRQSNPGTTVILWRDEGVFQGFYVCLKPLKDAFWSGCRPFIGFDGCFLKGIYGGQVLSAIGIDPNDCIFPLAYAVVLTESRQTWTWFMELLRDDLEIWNSKYITIMSDRQKGLKRVVEDIFPDAEHRNCVRHIYTNFREKFKGKTLKDYLWNVARATYVQRYILDARDKGIITMLEMIKMKLMRRIKKNKEKMLKYNGKICPKIQKKLDKMKEESHCYTPEFSCGPKVQIIGVGGTFIVDMVENTCTCRRWELTGLPCPHAINAIYGNNQQPEEFVHACYMVDTYMKVYHHFINPTNNEELWPEVNDGTRRRSNQAVNLEDVSVGSTAAANSPSQPLDFIGTQQSQTRQPSQITNKGPVLNVSISSSSHVSVANMGNAIYCTMAPQSPTRNRASS